MARQLLSLAPFQLAVGASKADAHMVRLLAALAIGGAARRGHLVLKDFLDRERLATDASALQHLIGRHAWLAVIMGCFRTR